LANADGKRDHIHRREDFDTARGMSHRVAVQRKAWRLIRIVARLLLLTAFAVLVVWPLVPLYDTWRVATKATNETEALAVVPQCVMNQDPEREENMSIIGLEICQRRRQEERQLVQSIAVTSVRDAIQGVVGNACNLLLRYGVVTPLNWLYQSGKFCLDTLIDSTMATVQLIFSYQFQSLSALVILLVAHGYNLFNARLHWNREIHCIRKQVALK
jgi:hypothetical protein